MKPESLFFYVVSAVVFVLIFVVLTFVFRWFSSITVSETVFEPEQNVHCVKLITSDGAAVDCWKVND